MVKNNEQMDSYSLAKIMGDLALSKKAENVVLLNMKGVSGFTDYFLICHGTGPLHVKAIYDAIENGLFDEGIKAWHREGYENKNWVLLDYVDVVCHVFDGESRNFYNLEGLWSDAEQELILDEAAPDDNK